MKFKTFFLFIAGLISITSFAQTVVIQSNFATGKDASIRISDNGAVDGNTNFEYNNFVASRTSINSVWYKTRSLIQFDLGGIPRNAVVTSATLTLYGIAHSTAGQTNAGVLQVLTTSWQENTVTWNNQPAARTAGQVAIPATASASLNVDLDVKNNVQEMVQNPSSNYGWIMKLNGEGTASTAELNFGSSDNSISKSPKLVITYMVLGVTQIGCTTATTANGSATVTPSGGTPPYSYVWTDGAGSTISTAQTLTSVLPGYYTVAVTDAGGKIAYSQAIVGVKGAAVTLYLQPSTNFGKDATSAYYDSNGNAGDNNYNVAVNFNAIRWTASGLWFRGHSFIAYDFSSIPTHAVVTSAKLYLYSLGHTPTSQANQQSNASTLQRVTSNWNEASMTWNTQPTTNVTGAIAVPQSTSPTQDYVIDITPHVKDMIRYPENNFGWMLKLNGENNQQYAMLNFASSDNTDATKRPKLEITFTIPDVAENGYNWVSEETYDNNGNVLGQSKQYTDGLGRTIQNQSLDVANSNVLVNQPVFDAFGRPALQTLTAPVFQNGIYYKEGFIRNTSANVNYTYNDFDKPITSANTSGQVNNPVGVTQSCRLGYYYGNLNSDEEYTPASMYPYTRTEYYDDPFNRVKRVAVAGDSYRMGSNHETKYYYMANAGELTYVYGWRTTYIEDLTDQQERNINSQLLKTIVQDADNKVQIVYKNTDGLTIATCRSGVPNTCVAQKIKQKIPYTGIVADFHLPASKKSTLKLPIDDGAPVNPQEGYGSNLKMIDYKFYNLRTGLLLTEGVDYSINRSTRFVTFLGSYATGDDFFRVSFSYTPDYIATQNQNNYPEPFYYPHMLMEYELDYSNWAINYYNAKGELQKEIQPEGNDCSFNPATQYTSNAFDASKPIAVATGSAFTYSVASTAAANFDQNALLSFEMYTPQWCAPRAPQGPLIPCPDPAGKPGDQYLYYPVIQYSLVGKKNGVSTVFSSGNEFYYKWKGKKTTDLLSKNMSISGAVQFDEIGIVITGIRIDTYIIQPGRLNYALNFSEPYNPSNSIHSTLISKYQLKISVKTEKYPSILANDAYITFNTYNKYGQLIKKVSRDRGTTQFIYDTEGKIRFTQNQLQKEDYGKYSYINYDRAGRVVETGEYNPNPNLPTQPGTIVYNFVPYNADGSVPANTAGTVHAIINESNWTLPDRISQNTFLKYDFAQSDFPGSLTGYDQNFKDGKLVKSSTSTSATWFGYDDLDRATWKVNTINGLGTKTVNYKYKKDGELDKIDYQKEVSNERFIHAYDYDANKRLQVTKTSFNDVTYTNNQSLSYYLNGSLKRVELETSLQGIDYVYTINNQLKSVNDPNLSNRDPGKDSYAGSHSTFKKDVFGFTLDYYTGDYKNTNTFIETYTPGGSNTTLPNLYSGQIRAMRWQTTLPSGAIAGSTYTSGMLQYVYKYDATNQLTEAIFGTVTPGNINDGSGGAVSPVFTEQTNVYRVNNITYDRNGNMKSLTRQGKTTALASMDALTYNYYSTKPNQLSHITDVGNAGNYLDDIKTQAASNYQYDVIGQLKKDVLPDYNYVYNMSGLVTSVQKSNGVKISTFEYNENGVRHKKTSYDASGNAKSHTWYVYGGFGELLSIYETTVGTGTTIQMELPVYGARRVGVFNKTLNNYVYELTDHLGNVRATIRNNAGNVEVLSFADYYPHGSPMPARNSTVPPAYKYAYQGQEKEENGFLNFDLRQYDPRIGRWFNPDPMGQHYSPYLAMGNNPISFIDPNGGQDGKVVTIEIPRDPKPKPQPHYNGEIRNHFDGNEVIPLNLHFDPQEDARRKEYIRIETIKTDFTRYQQYLQVKPDATIVYWCNACPHSNYQKPIPDFYEEKLDNTNPLQADWWVWGIKKWERDLKVDGPPAGVQLMVNINPLAAGYNALNGTFGDGTDIYGQQQSKVGVGLSYAGAILPFMTYGTNSVYQGFDVANDVRYVGITSRNPIIRFGEHLNSGTPRALLRYDVIEGATGLSRIQARIWEQRLINHYGLMKNGGQLYNEINSIGEQYWWLFGIK